MSQRVEATSAAAVAGDRVGGGTGDGTHLSVWKDARNLSSALPLWVHMRGFTAALKVKYSVLLPSEVYTLWQCGGAAFESLVLTSLNALISEHQGVFFSPWWFLSIIIN